jgi:hypothetical protein
MADDDTNIHEFPNGKPTREAAESILAQPTPEFLELLREYDAEMDRIAEERSQLNAQKTALEKSLEEKGINILALRAARQFAKLKEKHQDRWDLSYQVTRRALGNPVQLDLFEAQVAQTAKRANRKSAGG